MSKAASSAGANDAIEEMAARNYETAYRYVRKGGKQEPDIASPAYIVALTASALRQAIRGNDTMRQNAYEWRDALDYPLVILKYRAGEERGYSDVPSSMHDDEVVRSAGKVVAMPPLANPTYRVLDKGSIGKGQWIVALFAPGGPPPTAS
tara:strand:- start:393 stop:842 length:450 start_codon:yes stop_codon:yes gene_type:complete